MRRRVSSAALVFLVVSGACVHRKASDDVAVEARSHGAIWLPDSGAFPIPAREARDSVELRIRNANESPSDYYVVLQDKDSVFVFNVIHRNAFTPAGRLAIGNPGGVSGEITFDRRLHRVTQWGLWQ
jgi:hypothetical protein